MSLNLPKPLTDFAKDADGSATVSGMFFLLTSTIVLGLALDQAHGWNEQTQMQIAADAAALAASTVLDDPEEAVERGLATAAMNLGSNDIIQKNDITLGHIDEGSMEFLVGANASGAYDAVQVDASRTVSRGNAVPTFLMRLVGVDTMDIGVSSTAGRQQNVNTGGGFAGCEDAVFLSETTVQTGGRNEMRGAICIHGEKAVATGGGDLYGPEVRISSASLDNITLSSYLNEYTDYEDIGQLSPEHIKVSRSMAPVLLDQLIPMRSSIFDDLWKSRSDYPELWEQPDAPWGGKQWYYVGEYELSAADYSGILPDFVFDEGGNTTVHLRDQYWTIQPDELDEHAIYLSTAGIQFAGGVDIKNVAIVSEQNIGMGGGQLFFDDVFFIGTGLNFSGNVQWGAETSACGDIDYGVYVFGTSSLSLGGWANGSRVNGMVGAAPTFHPGGAMQGTGVYFETENHLDMGGATDLSGCGTTRQSEYTLTEAGFAQSSGGGGSYLMR